MKDVKNEAVKTKDELKENTGKGVQLQAVDDRAVDESGTGADPESVLDTMAEGYIPESNLPEVLTEQLKEQLGEEFEEEVRDDLEVTLVKRPEEQVKTKLSKEALLMMKEMWGNPEIEAIKIDGGEANAMKQAIKNVGNKLKEKSSRQMESQPSVETVRPAQVNPISSRMILPGQILTPKQASAVPGPPPRSVTPSNKPVFRTVEGCQVSVRWGKVLKNQYKYWCD